MAQGAVGMAAGWRKPSVLPGFGASLGFTLFAMTLVVMIPLAGLFLKAAGMSFAELVNTLTSARVAAAFKLSFGLALIAAAINAVFGLIVAWVLVRYRFPGRRLLDALVDLPFAL
ncbi:MAG: sulfate ABC transporter permease subunit CysT, partial [Rhodospirillales bacterium]|nr:sulfate ABC transporter permease subunit CysT [Rhodospirillales bacterium]